MMTHTTGQELQVDHIRSSGASEAARAFECGCDWIEALLARDPDEPSLDTDAHQRAADRAAQQASLATDTAEDTSCWVCGAPTRLPLICASCLDTLESLPDEPACPWLIGRNWCAAPVDLLGGELVKSRCGAALSCCEHVGLLAGRRAGACR